MQRIMNLELVLPGCLISCIGSMMLFADIPVIIPILTILCGSVMAFVGIIIKCKGMTKEFDWTPVIISLLVILVILIGILVITRSISGCWMWQTTEWRNEYYPIPEYTCEELNEIISLELYNNVKVNVSRKFCETDNSLAGEWVYEYFSLSDFKELYKEQCLK